MNQKNIFREKAVSSLSSPEKLKERMLLLSPKLWIGLVGMLLIIIVTCIWGYFGEIDTKVHGVGILMNEGIVRSVTSQSTGVVSSINVEEGSIIGQKEILAVIEQPLLEAELNQLAYKYILLKKQLDEFMKVEDKVVAVKEDYSQKMDNTADITINKLTTIQGMLHDLSAMFEKLQKEGASSKLEVYQNLQNDINAQIGLAAQKSAKFKLPVEKADLMSSRFNTIEDKIKEMKLLLNELQAKSVEYDLKTRIYSSVAGKVISVVKKPGDSVTQGETLFVIIPTATEGLVLKAYFSIKDWKMLEVNQLAYISLTNMPPARYGYMLGLVRRIGEYPSNDKSLESDFKNSELVRFLKQGDDVVVPVQIGLIADPSNPTGYKWTSRPPKKMLISIASPCNVYVVVEKRPPISFVIPVMKEILFGVGSENQSDKDKTSQ